MRHSVLLIAVYLGGVELLIGGSRYDVGHPRRVMYVLIITQHVYGVLSGLERKVRDVGRTVAVVVTVNLRLRRSFD